MGFPVQIVVHAPVSGELRSKSKAAARRLGTTRGYGTTSFWELDDRPDGMGRIAANARRLIESQTDRGEGGFARVLVADSASALRELVAAVGRRSEPGRWFTGAIVAQTIDGALAEELDYVHCVPEVLEGGRRLTQSERIQNAVNMLALFLDMARLPRAREEIGRWLTIHGGLRHTLAIVARIKGEILQGQLAHNLAHNVIGKMSKLLDMPPSHVPALPALGVGDQRDVLARAARAAGERVARTILGSTDEDALEDRLPDPRDLRTREWEVLRDLPEEVRDLMQRHGRSSVRAAMDQLDTTSAEVDRVLAEAKFQGLRPIADVLRQHVGDGRRKLLDRLPQGPLREASSEIDAPSTQAVEDAWLEYRDTQEAREPSSYLFGAWALILSCLGAVIIGVAIPGEPPAWLPAGWYLPAALAFLACAGALGLSHHQLTRVRLVAQRERYHSTCEEYVARWCTVLASRVSEVSAELERRELSLLTSGLEKELLYLDTVINRIEYLAKVFRDPVQGHPVDDGTFDRNIHFEQAFLDHARSIAPPGDLFEAYQRQIGAKEWRSQLGFMPDDGLPHDCRSEYARFRDRVPFDTHEVLAGSLEPAVKRVFEDARRTLLSYVPEDSAAARMTAAPVAFSDAAADPVGTYQRFSSANDLFVVVTWRP